MNLTNAPRSTVGAGVLLVCTALASPGWSQPALCPAPKPLPADMDDHRVREADFTRDRYSEGLAYFDALAKELAADQQTTALTEKEGFWIRYINSRIHLEGYALRLEAQLEIKRTGRGAAVRRFCDFVAR